MASRPPPACCSGWRYWGLPYCRWWLPDVLVPCEEPGDAVSRVGAPAESQTASDAHRARSAGLPVGLPVRVDALERLQAARRNASRRPQSVAANLDPR